MANALGTPGGVVSDENHRLAIAAMIAAGTTILDARLGVLVGPGTTALVTGTSATGTMTVGIAAHTVVSSRSTGDGAYLGPTLEAATTVNIAAAPGSNSRIDVVYAKQNDTGSTVSPDTGTTQPLYGVVTGTALVSPTKPPIPVGAVELATVQVAVGATSTNGAGVTITNTIPQTVARGGIHPVRSTDATAGAYVDQYRGHPTRGLERWDGTQWTTANPFTWTDLLRSTSYNYTPPTGSSYVDLSSGNFTVSNLPPGREIEFEWKAPLIAASTNATLVLRMLIAGTQADTNVFSTSTAPMFGPGRLTGSAVIPSGGSVLVQVQGFNGVGATATPIQAGTAFAASGAVVLRYRVR
jgi:hypothetical protein